MYVVNMTYTDVRYCVDDTQSESAKLDKNGSSTCLRAEWAKKIMIIIIVRNPFIDRRPL